MVAAEGNTNGPGSADADGEGVRNGRGLAPSKISASSRPKLSRARLMMTVGSCLLVVIGPADTSRDEGRQRNGVVHRYPCRERGRQRCQRRRDRSHPLGE
jgi:hypothetical protein